MLKVAVKAAKTAGKYALSRVGKIQTIDTKMGYSDLVTDVDKMSEKIVIGIIKKSFPEHEILAEESGKTLGTDKYTWVIDPIDGTTNFAHGFPFFCVSVGVMHNEEIILGAVYDPSKKELFTSIKGKGAYLNGKRIKVSLHTSIRKSMIATGFAYHVAGKIRSIKYFMNVIKKCQAIRRAGSAALDLCYVACGRFDGFWEFGLSPWDTAAAYLIVQEAGGIVTNLEGGKYDIYASCIAASNGKIHKKLLSILHQ
ncbi:MAG: inositol monophosphatase [Candidatus Omnitrophica bacterium]|nr:inositol monophosphatase [Candidatus Omnitrophota bacterium]